MVLMSFRIPYPLLLSRRAISTIHTIRDQEVIGEFVTHERIDIYLGWNGLIKSIQSLNHASLTCRLFEIYLV